MRFGLSHRIMTNALATLGLVALVASGELNRWISILAMLGLALALAVPDSWQDRAPMRQAGVVAPVVLLLLQGARWFLGGSLLPLAVEYAALLQVIRLGTRRGAAHDQQVIVLALLHLIAGTVLGGGLAYGLCFVGFLIVAPGALVLSHLRREVEGNYRQGARDRTGLPVDVPRILRSRRVVGVRFLLFTCVLSLPIFVFTALLFVAFPRVGLSLLLLNQGRPERMIGFSDRVSLGGVGKLRSDPTIAMRVEYPGLGDAPPQRLALYLRGTAFDSYDGRTWARTVSRRVPAEQSGHQVALTRYPDPARDRSMRIELEPIDPPVVFLPADAVALKVLHQGATLLGPSLAFYSGPEGELKYSSRDDRGLRYEVFLAGQAEPAPPALVGSERARYLTLPPGLPDRVRALARSWVGASVDPLYQARIVEARLRSDYAYDLDSQSGAASDPLDHFLFESRRGHCEFYSSAMAVLLRTLGVPTRNVTGFVGGTYNRFGNYYAVRQGDAHSWVEVYVDGRGWMRFDPTPPADAAPHSEVTGVLAYVRDFVEAAAQRWSRHVVGYDLRQQMQLLRSVKTSYGKFKMSSPITLGSPKRTIAIILGLLLIGWAVARILRRPRGPGAAEQQKPAPAPHASMAAELYRALEGALVARGVPRTPSTPPWAHAQALVELRHPIASEVTELTRIYIEARFGSRELGDTERRSYLRRVRALRQAKRGPALAA